MSESATAEAAEDQAKDTAGVPLPPPLIYIAGLLAGIGLEFAFPTAELTTAVALAGGIAGVAASVLLDGRATFLFHRAGTSPIPFKPTTALVTTGPFRISRNPMYVGMATLYAGVAFAFSLLWALAILPLAILAVDRLIIAREERYLERKFGDEYRVYKQRVRRWL